MRNIEIAEITIRKVLPLPSDVDHYIYTVVWHDEDSRRYDFFFEKIWHKCEEEYYAIGWRLKQVQEL